MDTSNKPDHVVDADFARQLERENNRLRMALATIREYHGLHNTASIESFVDQILANVPDEPQARSKPKNSIT